MNFHDADAINQSIRLLTLRSRARAAALLAEIDLYPGQEVLLLELARSGPSIQAQLSEALGCEPPSITLMAAKLEAAGHIRRTASPSDKRASVVELTDSGKALVKRIKRLWCTLAEDTVADLPADVVASLATTLARFAHNLEVAGAAASPGRRGR